MSEFIRKIYLDSRYRLSGTTSDYEIELPRTVTVAKNALGWITDLHLPVSWYNIDQHNNRLYVLTSAFVSSNIQTRAYVVDVTPGNYTAESLAAALRRNLNAAATASFPLQGLIPNFVWFVNYHPQDGYISIFFGINADFAGTYSRSNALTQDAVLTRLNDGRYSVADSSGNPLGTWEGGSYAYQLGTLLVFENGNVVGSYNSQTNKLVITASGTTIEWTPSHTVMPSGATPLDINVEFPKESLLRDRTSSVYSSFINPATNNSQIGGAIDPENVRSMNEDVLKAPHGRWVATAGGAGTRSGVLDLFGHGSPIYIMSPDLSSLSSMGPRGESSILAKVTQVEEFGKVITHSPFAELDYFRANSETFKRIRVRLVFSNGCPVDLHGANWSFSVIFQQAE